GSGRHIHAHPAAPGIGRCPRPPARRAAHGIGGLGGTLGAGHTRSRLPGHEPGGLSRSIATYLVARRRCHDDLQPGAPRYAVDVEVPPGVGARVCWTGVRTDSRAVVRVTNRGEGVVELLLSPWPGQVRQLSGGPGAMTFAISSDDEPADRSGE